MKDDIADKLNLLLAEGKEFDERTLVYFFAEVRKMIEHICEGLSKDERKKVYPIIKFYADWCLHIKKDNTVDFRDYLEKIVAALEKNKDMSFSEFLSRQERHGLAPLVELEELKGEFREFLRENDVATSFLEDKNIWSSFRNSLGRVLAEQPLDFGDKPIGNLRVKEIRFLDTNPKISCAFLISMKDADDKELGPFLFADDDPSASF